MKSFQQVTSPPKRYGDIRYINFGLIAKFHQCLLFEVFQIRLMLWSKTERWIKSKSFFFLSYFHHWSFVWKKFTREHRRYPLLSQRFFSLKPVLLVFLVKTRLSWIPNPLCYVMIWNLPSLVWLSFCYHNETELTFRTAFEWGWVPRMLMEATTDVVLVIGQLAFYVCKEILCSPPQ